MWVITVRVMNTDAGSSSAVFRRSVLKAFLRRRELGPDYFLVIGMP